MSVQIDGRNAISAVYRTASVYIEDSIRRYRQSSTVGIDPYGLMRSDIYRIHAGPGADKQQVLCCDNVTDEGDVVAPWWLP